MSKQGFIARARNERINGTAMAITLVNGKRGHGFEKEQGGLGGKTWREEKERGNYIIMP